MIIITGGSGFIGSHLYNTLKYTQNRNSIKKLPREAFTNVKLMDTILSKSSCIIHLAGVNRNSSERFIQEENIKITETIISSLKRLSHFPRFINISSIHENSETSFGIGKRISRKLLESYYNRYSDKILSLIAPNIFGPFGIPYYNSFIATFCERIINKEQLKITDDRLIPLLYVDDLIKIIYENIQEKRGGVIINFQTNEIKVSEVAEKLKSFEINYLNRHEFPNLSNRFDLNLFNTFRSYIPFEKFPVNQRKHTDERGSFVELVRSNSQGQFSISNSYSGIERGNHFHTRKIERFQIIKGEALVQIRKIDSDIVYDFHLSEEMMNFIDIPVWHTHNLINISDKKELIMTFWISEPYKVNDPDTFPLKVNI